MVQMVQKFPVTEAHTKTVNRSERLLIEMIDTEAGFLALKTAWQALEKHDPEGTVFLSWNWLREAFRGKSGQWRILALRRADVAQGYVCFFPMKYRLRWSKSRTELQSEIEAGGRLLWSEYTGFLCDPEWESQSMRLMAERVQSLPWAWLSLRYEMSENRARLFTEAFPADKFSVSWKGYFINDGETDNLMCPQVELPDTFEAYLQTCISAKTRYKLRKPMSTYLDTGEVRIREASTASFEQDLELILKFWSKRWKPEKGPKTTRLAAANYRRILTAAHKTGLLYMPVLWKDNRPLGAHGYICDPEMKRIHFIVSGRNTEATEPYIGNLLHGHSLRRSIEMGYGTYDFCHGNEAYKYSYGAKDKRANYFTIRRRGKAASNARFDRISAPQAMIRAAEDLHSGKQDRAAHICRQMADMLQSKAPRL